MRYLALATDYDGTLAVHGRVPPEAIAALKRLRLSGRRAILVTGRRLEDLMSVCPELDLFDCVVAENGGLVYSPRTREQTLLGKPPPPEFVERLRSLGVDPLDLGHVILGTCLPHHTAVVQAIQELGLELLVIFNGAAVMVLPPGVNKATGLDYALRRLGLSFHEAVGIGNAENDHSFLDRCECSAAVADAVSSLRRRTSFVTAGEAGQGVVELIDELVADDLLKTRGKLQQHYVPLGLRADGSEIMISPYGTNILIAGPSGSGKSTVTAGILERLMEQSYQICIVDPEGDYGSLQKVLTLGHHRHAVTVPEALAILEDPKINLNINLLGIRLADRPEFFGELFPSLRSLRTRTGRPHWLVLDEAHHMLSVEWGHLPDVLPRKIGETILVTVHPGHLPSAILTLMDVVIAVGPSPKATLDEVCEAAGYSLRWPEGLDFKAGKAVAWFPRRETPPLSMGILRAGGERIRHHRKYAEGDMRDHSFVFCGPEARHKIRAQNLSIFSVIAEGIEEETWLFHLYRGDYTRWFRDSVKDPYLADQTERIEQRRNLSPQETRELLIDLIEARYTLPE